MPFPKIPLLYGVPRYFFLIFLRVFLQDTSLIWCPRIPLLDLLEGFPRYLFYMVSQDTFSWSYWGCSKIPILYGVPGNLFLILLGVLLDTSFIWCPKILLLDLLEGVSPGYLFYMVFQDTSSWSSWGCSKIPLLYGFPGYLFLILLRVSQDTSSWSSWRCSRIPLLKGSQRKIFSRGFPR